MTSKTLRDVVALDFKEMDEFADVYGGWIEESVGRKKSFRDSKWTESVAVGSESFVTATKEKLWINGKWRKVIGPTRQ